MPAESKAALLLCRDRDLRPLLEKSLRARGFKTVTPIAEAAPEESMPRSQFDVVVWNDPVLGSWEHQMARAVHRHNGLPTVLIWASDQSGEALRELKRELSVAMVAYQPIVARDFAMQVLALLTPLPADKAESGKFALAFEPLRREFGVLLPGRLTELEGLVLRARTTPALMAEARQFAHRLRGSAGSYGYGAVGAAVGAVEDLLAEAAARPTALRRRVWEDVEQGLLQARRESEHGPSATDPQGTPIAPVRALLVVDDDAEFLHVVRQIGRKLVLEVTTAESVEEARQRARTTSLFGVVVGLPPQSGNWAELTSALRNTPHNAEVPIAFISRDVGLDSRMAALEAGGSRFFEKPLSEDAFTMLAQDFVALAATIAGRVLIVDDDPDVTRLYALLLRAAGIEVTALPSAEHIVEELERKRPDVLLLDVGLPSVSGSDVCRALRMSPQFQLLPILMVTARSDDATRLDAFRAGATDILTKPVIPEELLARVGGQLERARLLRDRADRDALSGLLLRRAFIEALQRTLASAVRQQQRVSLVLLDLDSFKGINDQHGHLAGDQVIARLGDLLRRRFRVEDLRGRWGGEEFVLAFPGADSAFAARATRQLLEEFGALEFHSDAGASFHATFTAGVAEYPADGTSISNLIRHADQRLYLGKRQGRNQVRCALPPPDPRAPTPEANRS